MDYEHFRCKYCRELKPLEEETILSKVCKTCEQKLDPQTKCKQCSNLFSKKSGALNIVCEECKEKNFIVFQKFMKEIAHGY